MSYQIFTDVTADLDLQALDGLPEVVFIPMQVQIGSGNVLYHHNSELTPQKFYDLQRQGNFASTSRANLYTCRSCFEKALQKGMDVLYLSFSSGLSGSFQSGALCASELKEKYPERKIVVIDTLCASIGEGLLVLETAQKQAQGYSLEQLEKWVYDHRMNCTHWFTVDSFDHLKHGGRVSPAAAAVGTILNIKPFLRLDDSGKLEVIGKPRGRKKADAGLIAKMEQGWMPELSRTVIIGHGDVPDAAEELKKAVKMKFPDADILTAYIGPIIGSHTGPGMVALVYWGTNR